MAAAKKIVEIKLPHVKTTKGTEAFGTTETGALCKSLYIQKEAFAPTTDVPVPSEITVTITV